MRKMIIMLKINLNASVAQPRITLVRESLQWANRPNWSGSRVRIQLHLGLCTRRQRPTRIALHRGALRAVFSRHRWRNVTLSAFDESTLPADDVRCHVQQQRPRNSADVTVVAAVDVGSLLRTTHWAPRRIASKRKMIECRGALRNGISGEQAHTGGRGTGVVVPAGRRRQARRTPPRSGHRGPHTTLAAHSRVSDLNDEMRAAFVVWGWSDGRVVTSTSWYTRKRSYKHRIFTFRQQSAFYTFSVNETCAYSTPLVVGV